MSYYLGIDGGGTKTTCVVADRDSVLATAVAGPSNIVRVGEEEARRSLHLAIGQACAAAGITPHQISRACIGAAGASSVAIADVIRRSVAEIVPAEVIVTSDVQIALEAAFPAAPGIVVIAGTGSIAWGRDASGNTARAGGWGFAISDEGSAHWIGRKSVAAIFRAWDIRKESILPKGRDLTQEAFLVGDSITLFSQELQKRWNANSIGDLVRVANSLPPPNFAALVPAVLASAEIGDPLCRGVLVDAGSELSRLAAIVVAKLFPKQGNQGPTNAFMVPLAMAGGVFRHSALVREAFYNAVTREDSRIEVLPQVVEPVEGAVRMARAV